MGGSWRWDPVTIGKPGASPVQWHKQGAPGQSLRAGLLLAVVMMAGTPCLLCAGPGLGADSPLTPATQRRDLLTRLDLEPLRVLPEAHS